MQIKCSQLLESKAGGDEGREEEAARQEGERASGKLGYDF